VRPTEVGAKQPTADPPLPRITTLSLVLPSSSCAGTSTDCQQVSVRPSLNRRVTLQAIGETLQAPLPAIAQNASRIRERDAQSKLVRRAVLVAGKAGKTGARALPRAKLQARHASRASIKQPAGQVNIKELFCLRGRSSQARTKKHLQAAPAARRTCSASAYGPTNAWLLRSMKEKSQQEAQRAVPTAGPIRKSVAPGGGLGWTTTRG